MDFIQLVGFAILWHALILCPFSARREQKRRAEHPEEFEMRLREEERAYKELLSKLELPSRRSSSPKSHPHEEKKSSAVQRPRLKAPEVKRQVSPAFKFSGNADSRHQKSQIEQRNYQSRIEKSTHQFKQTVAQRIHAMGG